MMSFDVQSNHSTVNTSDPQVDGFQALKSLVVAVNALNQDSSYKYASTVLEENTRLQKQLDMKNEESIKLTNKIKEIDAAKETAYKEMFDVNEKERRRHVDAMKSVNSLNSAIQDKEKALGVQREEIKTLNEQLKNLETSYNKEKETVVRANHEIDDLQKTVKTKDVFIEELKSAGSKIKRALAELQKKHKELETAKLQTDESLEEHLTRLTKLEGYVGKLHQDEETVLLDKFFSFWEHTSQAFVVHMKDDIPADQLQNQQAWKKLRMPANMSHQVPLPQSNSNAAKKMRLVVFLAILARELNEHIFQPSYISQNENDIRDILLDEAMRDANKESFCRAMLLAINPEKQAMILEERKKTVIRNAGSYFLDLLSPARYEGFRKSLEDVVEQAYEMWKPIQYTKNRYEPDFEPLEEEWESFPFANSSTNTSHGHHLDTDEPVLTIYPRICRVGSQESKTLHFATVLTRSQCKDAELEQKKREPSSPKFTRAIPERQRNRGLSISLASATNHNGSFLEGEGQSNGH